MKLSADFHVTPEFRNALLTKQSDAAFICYQRLKSLTAHFGLEEQHHRQFVRSALKGEIDQTVFVDCLLDDISILQKIPSNEMSLWFAMSVFAGCQLIPHSIINVHPMDRNLMEYQELTNVGVFAKCFGIRRVLYEKNPALLRSFFSKVVKTKKKFMIDSLMPLVELFLDRLIDSAVNDAIDANLLSLLQTLLQKVNDDLVRAHTALLNRAVEKNHPEIIDYLLQIGMQPDITTLHAAARSGDLERLIFFVTRNSIAPDDMTLLAAAKSHHLKMVRYLIETHLCKPDQEVLNAAVASGDIPLVDYLLNPNNLFSLIITSDTLNHSAESHHLPMLVYLLDRANLKLNPEELQEILCKAAKAGDLSMLLYIKNRFNLTLNNLVFLNAIKSGNIILVKFLVDPKNNFNFTVTDFEWCDNKEYTAVSRYLFHPDTPLFSTANTRVIVTPCQQYLDEAFDLDTFRSKGSFLHLRDEAMLGIAADSDWEYFFVTMDAILREGKQNFGFMTLKILTYSPIPTTQFLIAEYAISNQTSLDLETIRDLLENAKIGFALLGNQEWAAKADALLTEHNTNLARMAL